MEKLYYMFNYQAKRIIRKKVWCILLSVGIVASIGCFYLAYLLGADPIMTLSQTVFGQALLTLSFMMIGVELRREDRQENIDVLAITYLRKSAIFPLSQIIVICFFAAIATALVISGCSISLAADFAPQEWILSNAMQIILLFFLPCVVLGIWGLLISHLVPGKNVYLLAALSWLLTSSLSIYFTGPLSDYFVGWRLVANIFGMGFINYQMYQNIVTGAKIEFPRWIARVACAVFLMGMYLVCYIKGGASTKHAVRIRKKNICVVLACGIALFAFIGFRYSVFFIRFADDTYTQRLTYEQGSVFKAEQPATSKMWNTEKNITVLSEEIDLSCTTQGLNLEVLMTATADSNVIEQSFTLFADFMVNEICVDGEPATFERSLDGIIVHLPQCKKPGETVQFLFKYHGYSLPCYPANETTVQLNRSFPWLPWPGIRIISESEITEYGLTEVFFIDEWQYDSAVQYTMKYTGPGNVYTNLEEIKPNVYTGSSDNGVALYSGMLHKKYQDIDVYYPSSLYRYADIAAEAVADSYSLVKSYCEYWNTPILPEEPTSVVLVQMRYPMWGTIFFSPNELYSFGETWEIRMRNESSAILANQKLKDLSGNTHETSRETAIQYLLSPCSGYPTDASPIATDCFADLMAFSTLARKLDSNELQFYTEQFKLIYLEEKDNTLSEHFDMIVSHMKTCDEFDRKLKGIYHRLLKAEDLTVEDIINLLVSDLEGYNEH